MERAVEWIERARGAWAPARRWLGLERDARSGPRRAYLELHGSGAELARAAEEIEAGLEAVPGVAWARVNVYLGRVVVCCSEPVDSEVLAAALDRVERRHGLAGRAPARRTELYPGDPRPEARTLIEIASDVVSLGIGAAMRRARVPHVALELDVAALLSVLENTPSLRARLERLLSGPIAELGLELGNAVVQAVLGGELGQSAAIFRRVLVLRELRARRALWDEREAELGGEPERHPAGDGGEAARPAPLRDGPIEAYAGTSVVASLGAFAVGAVATRSLEDGAAALFAGIPRQATLGREAFAAHLGWRLARAGILVMDPGALRRLDRIDCVFVASRLARRRDAAAARLRAEVDRAGLRLVEGSDLGAADAVRTLQREGRAVLFVADGGDPASAAADVAVGLSAHGDRPPWGAHIIAGPHLAGAASVVAACAAARTASRQSVHLAMLEVATSAVLSLSGLRRETTRRVMATSNAAAILAMANGVRIASRVDIAGVAGGAPDRPADEQPPWHSMAAGDVLERIASDRGGLSHTEAVQRRREPPPEPSALASFAHMVGQELANPMAPILGVGAGLSAVTGAPVDAALIATVVAANGVIGGAQRYRTEQALAHLDRTERPRVIVRRGGADVEVDARDVVVGDIVRLSAGDVVPADCRLLDARGLEVDESSLTGESLPVTKAPEPVGEVAVADRTSMLYDGTTIDAGKAEATVVACGDDTEARRSLDGEELRPPDSGVEARLDSLTRLTAPVAAGGGLLVAATGLLRGQPLRDVVATAVSLAVAAVPEGLPVLATVSQLAAAGRLSEHGALVRNPRAIEALGRVDIVCADKTGTLTEGELHLVAVSDGAREERVSALSPGHRRILAAALRATPSSSDGDRFAHMTDAALVAGAHAVGVTSHDADHHWQRIHELPFAPGRGFSAGLAAQGEGVVLTAKGAPEVILPRCELTSERREALAREAERLARRGLRILAVAERAASERRDIDDDRVDRLAFLGFACLADPVRPTARDAIGDLRRAGIDVIMVTGDHPSTARAIADELGLEGEILTGTELEELGDDQLDERIAGTAVVARVSPAQKVRIVRALQHRGRVVAMTGDGANDAQAIRLADVGVALGKHATPAARHAADMVVVDGRIETIVRAALEGRALWRSVRDAVAILVGGNLGEIAFTVAGALVAGRSPLDARQLLFVNLLTDAVPALALALHLPTRESPEKLIHEGPEASLGAALERDIAWRAVCTAGAASAGWIAARLTGTRARAGTVALLALTGAQLGQTLVIGGRSRSVLAAGLGSVAAMLVAVETPVVSRFFGCRPLGPLGLAQAGAAAAAGTVVSVVGPPLGRRLARFVRGRGAGK